MSRRRTTRPAGRRHWADDEVTWGTWEIPEASLRSLPEIDGRDVIELGFGTAYTSSRLPRAPHALRVGDAGMGPSLALRGDLGRPPRGARIARRLTAAVASVALAAALAAPPASGADPGRWRLAQADSVPLSYFQGLTHSAGGAWFFDGITVGLFRTDRDLVQKTDNPSALTPDLTSLGFNHIGDLTWDAREGGRLLLPLECYVPGQPNGGNTCGRGAIGVADPATLKLRYAVGLDPADIAKAMWAEVSPGGSELWTSSGRDLLAYDVASIAPGAPAPPRPVRRLAGAVPPSGVTGAAFYRGRLFLAGQDAGALQLWSVDVTGATPPVLELELPGVAAESEGLDVLDARGGVLHWLLSPFPANGAKPTYGTGHSELLTFVPAADARLRVRPTPARLVAGRTTRLTVTVTERYAGRVHRVQGARVNAGAAHALTGADGTAGLTVRRSTPGALRVTATKQRLLAGRASLAVTRG